MLNIVNIKNLITKLESIGVDVSLEKEKIYGTQNNMGSATMSLSQNDSELIDIYNSLKRKLDKSNLLLSTYDYCKSIESNVLEMPKKHKGEIDIDELNDYISKIEDYLINLKDNNISNNNKIYEKIFEVVYALIDAEIIKTNRSTLYDFIKSKNIDTRFINSILCREINEINESKNDNQDDLKTTLNNIITKTNNTGLNNNYFNLEIIKLLLMFKSDYDVYQELEQEFTRDFAEYSKNNNAKKTALKVGKYANYLPKSKQEKKESKIDLIKKSIASALAASVVITGAYGIERGIRKLNTSNSFIKTTEITSPLSEVPITEDEKIFYNDSTCPSEQYIRVVTPWTHESNSTNISRSVKEYDITYLNLPDLSNLDNIDLDSLDITPDVYEERRNKNDTDSVYKYNNNMRELINISYKYNGEELDKFLYGLVLFLIYFCCLAALILAGIFVYNYTDYKTLKEIIDFYIENRNDFENHLDEFRELANKLLASISSNQELMKEFNKIYQENKNLIYDTDSLKNKIDTMISQLTQDNNYMEMSLERAKRLEKELC